MSPSLVFPLLFSLSDRGGFKFLLRVSRIIFFLAETEPNSTNVFVWISSPVLVEKKRFFRILYRFQLPWCLPTMLGKSRLSLFEKNVRMVVRRRFFVLHWLSDNVEKLRCSVVAPFACRKYTNAWRPYFLKCTKKKKKIRPNVPVVKASKNFSPCLVYILRFTMT